MSALLTYVNFHELHTWSPHLLLSSGLIYTDKYPLATFKDFTQKGSIEKIHIEDIETYKILGVRSYGKGVYLNREVLGSTLKMRTYQKAKKNHLFWCKVDTKNGAFGIIPENLKDGIGSSNMTFAELDTTKIDTNYLQLFFKSQKFNTYMDSLVVGTTNRKYIKFNDLLNDVKIPLPSLEKQKEIVKNIQKFEISLMSLEQEYKQLLKIFNQNIFQTSKDNIELLEFINYSKLGHWGANQYLTQKLQYNEDYPLSTIGNFLLRNKTFVHLKDNEKYKRVTIKLYNKGVLIRDIVYGSEIKTKKQYLVKEGQFLLSKIDARNGAFGIAIRAVDNAIISADFFAYDIDTNMVDPFFLSLITTTQQFMKFAQSASSGTTGRQRIDEQKFLNTSIPLPSLTIQKELIKKLKDNKSLQKEIINKRTVALQEFEKEIFNEN